MHPQYFNGTVPVEKISTPGNLDGIKLKPSANTSSSDWWYFNSQVTTPGDNSTVEIVFFNSGDFKQQPHPLSVQVTGVFPNGTRFHKTSMADGGATVIVDEKGVRGQWKGAEANFSRTAPDKPDLTYTINIYGTYESYSSNPVLTNRGTDEYFQTVGHADLFPKMRLVTGGGRTGYKE
ncbi:glycoside hydrolase family 43 protein [Hypoxylon sp. CI-4A]|nr:glycoside hydrolase family 43 protein [Hypoxylon sp. CI-4A]